MPAAGPEPAEVVLGERAVLGAAVVLGEEAVLGAGVVLGGAAGAEPAAVALGEAAAGPLVVVGLGGPEKLAKIRRLQDVSRSTF